MYAIFAVTIMSIGDIHSDRYQYVSVWVKIEVTLNNIGVWVKIGVTLYSKCVWDVMWKSPTPVDTIIVV